MKKQTTLFTILCICFLTAYTYSQTVKTIPYSYVNNYKAIISYPKTSTPSKKPVIVYSYDEFYDWAGKKLANSRGYNLNDICKFFNQWGYVCVIPVERYRKVKALTGIVEYLKKQDHIDSNNIHLVGMSEGAFMQLIALEKLTQIQSITLIAPLPINDKGYLSMNRMSEKLKNKTSIPILFFEAKDIGWRINSQRKLYNNMKDVFTSIEYHSYNVKKRWFWDLNHSYSKQLKKFLRKHYN